MRILQRITDSDHLKTLADIELHLGKSVLLTNCSYSPGQSILIVSDTHFYKKEAAVWFEAAKTLETPGDITMLVLDGMTHSGQNPPDEVVRMCGQADIVLLHTHFSLTHTTAGQAAKKSGASWFSLPGVDYEMMLRTIPVEYEPLHELGEQIKTMLESGTTIHITSAAGTDLTAAIRTECVINDSGIHAGNLPAGEVFFAPLEKTTQGTWVINASLADFETEMNTQSEPVVLTIKDGVAVDITGGAVAQALTDKLTTVGSDAFIVAEIGIGTNPLTNPHGMLIEAEKALGTAHLALGNSIGFGGSNDVPIHLDGVTLEPVIRVDGKLLATTPGKS